MGDLTGEEKEKYDHILQRQDKFQEHKLTPNNRDDYLAER